LLGLLACLTFTACLATAATDGIAGDVGRLVGQLASGELATRETAEDQLVKLGPAALPFLPSPTDRMPAETSQRLARVRQALEQARAVRAAAASRVTIEGTFSVSELLKELGRQSGNAIVDRRMGDSDPKAGNDAPLAVDFRDKPFWQALDEVLDRAGLDIDSYASGAGLAVVPRSAGRLSRVARASYAGPMRIEPVRFESLNDLRRPANQSLKLFLEVGWEPRLRPILISQSLQNVQATAAGQPLAVDGRGDITAPLGDGPTAVSLEIPLTHPPRTVTAIELKGQLKVLVPADVEAFRFQFPKTRAVRGPKPQQHKGMVTVTLDSVHKSGDAWELEVSARFDDPALAIDSYLIGWLVDNKATLERDGRQPVAPVGLEQTRQTPKEVGVKYRFPLSESLEGWTLVYQSPTAVLEVPVDYRFTNLDLP
jgi:hypothetical protein